MILRPDKNTKVEPHHIWPSLTADEWVKVEVELKNLILADYAKINNVNVASLTKSEIKDIILGMEIQAPNPAQQQIQQIENNDQNVGDINAHTVETTNIHGQKMVTIVTSPYEQQKFNS